MTNPVDRALRVGEHRTLSNLKSRIPRINEYRGDLKKLDDDSFHAKALKLRDRYRDAHDDTVISREEMFAYAAEACRRILKLDPYDVQLMAGLALDEGNIAQMKTGEGKTLAAVMPAYANALTGDGVHVVTVNEYLAQYQSAMNARVFNYLGLTCGCVLDHQLPAFRKSQYACDVTYGTNSEFGFDYLRDSMALSLDEQVQTNPNGKHTHHFAIVDEVDSILIDEARTPLIISGPAKGHASRWYAACAKIAPKLVRDEDYDVDEKKKVVGLLTHGVDKVDDLLGVDNIYSAENAELIGCLNNALKAKELFTRDKDYIVRDKKVMIVDEHTGRVLDGRRYSEELHQAIEAKEHVPINPEDQTYATITLQNYFRMYDKLSGMTGTADTEAAEFARTYRLDVIDIPTNKPMIRVDHEDLIYRTMKDKLNAITDTVEKIHKTGQPILVGTASVESSQIVSELLKRRNIPHSLLSAKQNAHEASVVAMAGMKNAVTVATNMAGRGTDIMLGGNTEFIANQALTLKGLDPIKNAKQWTAMWPKALELAQRNARKEHDEVAALGGLYVIGTERHQARRIDNQLIGRAGRQGDPGESRFFISLQDDLMRLFNTDLVKRIMNTTVGSHDLITSKRVSKGVRTAQRNIESRNYEQRKNVLKYDDVMNKQRTVVYAVRQAILENKNLNSDLDKALAQTHPDDVALLDKVHDTRCRVGKGEFDQFENIEALLSLDELWREHLYDIDYLKEVIGLRGFGLEDPLTEYRRENHRLYEAMIDQWKRDWSNAVANANVDTVQKVVDDEKRRRSAMKNS